MENDELNHLRIIKIKSDLVRLLINGIMKHIREVMGLPEFTQFQPHEQIALVVSAFTSIITFYGFDKFELVNIIPQEQIKQAQEVIELEKQLNKETDNDRK